MKKLGLTVAEILITTTIVGLISAITIPTLVNNSQQKVLVNSLPVMITNIEKTLQNIMIKENVTDLSETNLWINSGRHLSSKLPDDTILKNFAHEIGIFYKVVGGTVNDYYKIMYTIKNAKNTIIAKYSYTPFEFKNGSVVFIEAKNSFTTDEEKSIENTKKLLLKLEEYKAVVYNAAKNRTPYLLTKYLQELAANFHQFYASSKVIVEDEKLMLARLAVVNSVITILKSAMNLIAVSAPDRM